MKNILIKFFSCILLLTATALHSQNLPGILLNNAEIILYENMQNYEVKSGEAYNGYVVRIIQFSEIPSQRELHTIEKKNIKLLYYLPHNAYYAAIPITLSGNDLKKLGVKAWTIPVEEFKLSPNMYQRTIPDHAFREDGKIEIVILPYKHIPVDALINNIQTPNFEVLRIDYSGNYLEAACHINDIEKLVLHPFIAHIFEAEAPPEKDNNTAITNHRVNIANGMDAISTGYTGAGVTVSLGDDGAIGPHIDYTGRLDQSAADASSGDHGDHVAGTIFGAGNRDPRGRGMAPGANILYYRYPHNLHNAADDYNIHNIRITSSSYSNGCNAGYTNFTHQMDQTSHQLPGLLHVFSAGNAGNDNCGYGAGSGWGNITGGHKVAKNVIAVGNVNRFDNITASSSRGPAHDGRIKPEVVAVGTQVYSTTFPHIYTTKTGTSMACPGVAGTLAIMYEAYQDITQSPPTGGLMKALLMNGADDLGNPGPDFIYGFGRINLRKSLRMIENDWIIEGAVTHNNSNTHSLIVPPNVEKLKVMLYWTDKEANPGAVKALVNDLDLEMSLGSTVYQPLILNHTPNAYWLMQNAQPGRDTINNVEQITIHNPTPGIYDIHVNGSLVPFGLQNYYIVYYFENEPPKLTYPIGNESFVPSTTEIIRWDAYNVTDDFDLQYSDDGGNTWQTITSGLAPETRYYSWGVPNILSDQVKIRLINGLHTVQSNTFTVIDIPENLELLSVCLDSTTLHWDAVNGATGYVVYKLGNMYMDSVGYTTATTYTITNVNGLYEQWYSVSAVADGGGVGRRAIAIPSIGLYNCTLEYDLGITDIQAPGKGLIPDCVADSIPLTIKIKNLGLQNITDFTLHKELNNAPSVSYNISLSLNSGDSTVVTPTYITPTPGIINNITLWVELSGDLNPYNDTARTAFEIYTSLPQQLPIVEDFESQSLCATTNNCEATLCPLIGGFINAENGIFDDIDWRVNSGTTPSQNTGPSVDNTLGNSSGKYVYLEATSCYGRKAELYTPCIDLTNASTPILEFYHHRRGNATGPLSVEVFHDGTWKELISPITEETGTSWVRYEAGLVPYIGEKIALRFVGHTIGGWQGDIALDDISIFEYAHPPTTNFSASPEKNCLQEIVSFFDISEGHPTAWEWHINPPNYTVINGNNQTQNLDVVFDAPGMYSITLITSNSNGTDTLQKLNYIEIFDFPADPVVADDTIAYGSQAMLIASSSAQIFWYDSLNAMSLLHFGDTLITPPLYASTTYYAQASTHNPKHSTPELLYYNFNKPGTEVENLAINPVGNNPAFITGSGLTIGSEGMSGLALEGNGANSANNIINTGWNTKLDGSFTISFWSSNITPGASLYYIWGDPGANSLRCFTNSSAGTGNWLVRGGGLPDLSIQGGGGLDPNVVHIIYDSDHGSYSAYVDSVMVNSIPVPQGHSITGTGFTIGGYASTTGLSGLLDEFKIYDRALSYEEILANLAPTYPACNSNKVPVNVHVVIPQIEPEIVDIASPKNLQCIDDLGIQNVSLLLTNNGTDAITSNLTATYIINNDTPVVENVLQPILSGDTILFTFSTPIHFNMNAGDTTFQITAFINHPDDPYQNNDTISELIRLTHTPTPPATINDTIFAGGIAELHAFSAFDLKWYASDALTDINVINTGGTLITPPLFVNTPYYVSASENSREKDSLETTFNMGSGCGAGNMFNLTAIKEDLIITGFTITPRNTNSSMPVNIYYKVGTYSGFETNPGAWTQVGSYTVDATVNTPVFVSCDPFTLSKGQIYGVYVQYDSRYTATPTIETTSNAYLQFEGGVGLCASFSSVYTPRMFNGRIHYELNPVECESTRTEVWTIIKGTAPQDAGIVEILNPAPSVNAGIPQDVEVIIRNFGTDTLFSIPLSYRVNDALPVQETWTGTLPPHHTTNHAFSTPVNANSNYVLCAYTILPGDIYHHNDTSCTFIEVTSLDYDIGVLEILSPVTQTTVGQPVDVSARIKNYGTEAITSFDISYTINGGLPVVENWTGFLQATQEIIYDFSISYNSPEGPYDLCVEASHINDLNPYNNIVCETINGVVGISEKDVLEFSLRTSMPNPAQDYANIGFSLPYSGQIYFKITNLLGQKVYTYSSFKTKGAHLIEIKTSDLSDGVYYYTLIFDEQQLTKKLVIKK